MRPLTVIPRHAITGLALSPDGQQLGVVQAQQGFRLLDALTGAELARDTQWTSVAEMSPTGRHSMWAYRPAIRLAEVAAGKPFLCFQTGWVRARGVNRPPESPGTSPLQYTSPSQSGANLNRKPSRSDGPHFALGGCALTADHRLAVGEWSPKYGEQRFSVIDLAAETFVGHLRVRVPKQWEPVGRVFARNGEAVVAVTAQAVSVFELPPASGVRLESSDAAPVLKPVAEFRVTQPGLPPFALLPCGRKLLVRGERSRVELRDLMSGEVLTVWKWGLQRVHAMAVAADGLTAAAGGFRGQVVIWDLG